MDSTIIAALIGGSAAVVAAVLPVYLKHRHTQNQTTIDEYKDSTTSRAFKQIDTWGGKATFKYAGSVKLGTEIHFGKTTSVNVTKAQYQSLLKIFKGKSINVASSFTSTPEAGSLEEWLQKNITKVSISTYVAAILKNEGYAIRNGAGKIEFNP